MLIGIAYGARGLKPMVYDCPESTARSRPTRGATLDVLMLFCIVEVSIHAPHGARGLKFMMIYSADMEKGGAPL